MVSIGIRADEILEELLRKMVDKPFQQKLIHTIPGVGLKVALEEHD